MTELRVDIQRLVLQIQAQLQPVAHTGIALLQQQAGFAHAKPLQFISGQVNATAHGVFADIANDVGQLQGAPQSVRIFGGLWLGLPKDAG